MGFFDSLRPEVKASLIESLEGTMWIDALDNFWDHAVGTLHDVITASIISPVDGGASEEEVRLVRETLAINVVAAMYGFVVSEIHCLRQGSLCGNPKHALFQLLADPNSYMHPKPDLRVESVGDQSQPTIEPNSWSLAAAAVKSEEDRIATAMAVGLHEKGN